MFLLSVTLLFMTNNCQTDKTRDINASPCAVKYCAEKLARDSEIISLYLFPIMPCQSREIHHPSHTCYLNISSTADTAIFGQASKTETMSPKAKIFVTNSGFPFKFPHLILWMFLNQHTGRQCCNTVVDSLILQQILKSLISPSQ